MRLTDAFFVDVRRAERQLDLERRVFGAVRRGTEHLDEAFPVVRFAVEGAETFPVACSDERLAQRAQGTAVLRIDLEHALPRACGLRRVREVLAVHRTELLQDLHDLGVVVRELDPLLERLRERRPVLLALRELLERVEGAVREWVVRHDLLPQRDRVRVAMQALAGELGELDVHRHALAEVVDEIRLAALHVEERLPCALLRVDVLELLDRAAVATVELEHLLERLGRLVEVGEAVDPQLRDAHVDRDPVLLVHRVDATVEHVDEVVPATHRLVRARERVERLRVIGCDRQELVVRIDDHHIETQLVSVDGDELLEERDLLGPLRLGVDLLDLAPEQLDEGVPLLGATVERLEVRARLDVARVHLEDGFPRVDRAVGLCALLGGAGELHRETELLVRGAGAALRVVEDLHEACVVLAEVLAVELEHAGMRGIEPAHLREVRLCLLRGVPDAPVHHRELEQDALLGLELLTRAERVFVERDEVVPLLAFGEVLDEELERLVVARDEVLDTLVADRGEVDVFRLRVHAPRRQVQGDLLVAVLDVLRGLEEDLRELRPLLTGTQRDGVEARDAPVRRVGGAGSVEELVDLFVLTLLAVLPDDARGLREHRGLEVRITREVRLLDEAVGDLAEALRRALEVLDGLFDVVVLRRELEHPTERDERAFVVEQLVAPHPRELLQEQREERGVVFGDRRLDVDELRHRPVLCAALVPTAGALEQAQRLLSETGGIAARNRFTQSRHGALVVRIGLQHPEIVGNRQLGHRAIPGKSQILAQLGIRDQGERRW